MSVNWEPRDSEWSESVRLVLGFLGELLFGAFIASLFIAGLLAL